MGSGLVTLALRQVPDLAVVSKGVRPEASLTLSFTSCMLLTCGWSISLPIHEALTRVEAEG